MKQRIVYFQQNLSVGACEEYLCLLMEGINKLQFEPVFLCPRDSLLEPMLRRMEALGIETHQYPIGVSNCMLIAYLWLLFRKIKPDTVHFNDPAVNGIIAARLAGLSNLIMTHHTPQLDRKYNLKGRLLEKFALRHCGLKAIFVSEFNIEIGIKKDKIAKDRSFVIHCGLPTDRFSKRYDKKEVYDEFSLDSSCRIIGNIGRLSWQKGQEHLVRAAAIVVKQVKSVKFLFVGQGELEIELKARIETSGLKDYFIFTGYRNDIPRLLSVFEMLVMPSLFEGLSFAVIEAFAMGVPVIATPVGGIPTAVIDGKTGIMVAPGDFQELADAIIWMLEHPQQAKEMGLAGKKRFAELFTQERMVKETEALYKKLIEKKNAES